MTEQGTGTPPTEDKQDKKKPYSRWWGVIGGLIAIVFGGSKLIEQFTLPSCTSDRTDQTIRSIFKGKEVTLTKISDMKARTDTFSEKTCTAHIETADETANIDYKIYWQGWSAQVLIEKVRDEAKK
jgi:hypothetical protein